MPAEFGTHVAGRNYQNTTVFDDTRISWGEHGALLTFDLPPTGDADPLQHSLPSSSTTLLARVGVSFISASQACTNAEEEIPDFDFDDVRQAARKQWNDLLGRIQVRAEEKDRDNVVLFYSSVSMVCSTQKHSFVAENKHPYFC